jgi:sodium/bile acid cotransporter 7
MGSSYPPLPFQLVAVIFFISGLSLPLAHLVKRAADWRLHLVCQVTSFLVFPAVVLGVVNAVRAADPNGESFDRWALVGLVVMGYVFSPLCPDRLFVLQADGHSMQR